MKQIEFSSLDNFEGEQMIRVLCASVPIKLVSLLLGPKEIYCLANVSFLETKVKNSVLFFSTRTFKNGNLLSTSFS